MNNGERGMMSEGLRGAGDPHWVDVVPAGKFLELPESVAAPVNAGQRVGTLRVYDGDTVAAEVPVAAASSVEKRTWRSVFTDLVKLAVFIG